MNGGEEHDLRYSSIAATVGYGTLRSITGHTHFLHSAQCVRQRLFPCADPYLSGDETLYRLTQLIFLLLLLLLFFPPVVPLLTLALYLLCH